MTFDKIVEEFQTPFYLYNEEIILKKINFLKNLKLNINHKFHFAVKANPNLAILNILRKNNLGAEVVSSGELFKSLKAGFEPKDIIFDGPGKTEFDLKYAITQRIQSINIENLDEISIINDYSISKGLRTSIGIRINPDIDGDTLEKITTGKSGGKFGVSVDQVNFDDIKKLPGIQLNCLSVHIGSQIIDHTKLIEAYRNLVSLADELNSKGFEINSLDFGGGFAVLDHANDQLDFKKWKVELENLLSDRNYKIIFEPGRFIIADSAELITKVLYIKKSGNKLIAIVDSSFSEYIRPALYDITPLIQTSDFKKREMKYDIAGGICESTDFFIKDVNLPELKKGDIIRFLNVGAYGSSMASTYNSRPRPLEILFNKQEYRVIRSRDTLEDLCKNEII